VAASINIVHIRSGSIRRRRGFDEPAHHAA
jgi:hypothetical protein